jgi:hypothetical protein
MPRSGTTWQPGQSGNQKGRPRSGRALAEQITRELTHGVNVDSKRVSGKRLLAQLVTTAALRGEVKLPDDRVVQFNSSQVLDIWKFLLTHLDGPAKAELDVSSDGEVRIVVVYEDDEPRPEDQAGAVTPGADEGVA